jgi:hypothetical protein
MILPNGDLGSRPTSIAALMVCAVTASCGMPTSHSEDLTVERGTDAIIGGTATSARPEVGRIFTKTGKCTATLISPSYFITAAHCVSYSVKSGGTFHIEGAPDFTIDTIIPFGADSINDESKWDVALGRLTSSVPASVATPAAIADHSWNTGEVLTEVGYGCNNSNGTGSGTKRYLEANQGSFDNLCPGDSGGPLFRGPLADLGAIVGVASSAGGGDSFGQPVQFKKRIPSMMRFNDLGLEAGLDRPGSDYDSFSTVGSGGLDAWVCAAACEADGACKAFSYDNNRQLCFKKNAIPSIVPKDNIFSGLPRAINAVDRPGSDYASSSVSSADICQSMCARDNGCQSFTFFNGTCFLKNAIPDASSSCQSCVSGNRRALEDNTDRPGSDFAHPTTADAQACATLCAQDWRCFAFTWNKITHQCHEKNEIRPPVHNTDGISAMRDGLEVDSFRTPGPVTDPALSLSTELPEECQAACAANSSCLTWNYFPAVPDLTGKSLTNPPKFAAFCELNSIVGAVHSRPGTAQVSGVKGMEFF